VLFISYFDSHMNLSSQAIHLLCLNFIIYSISKIKAAVTEHEIEFKRSLELSDEVLFERSLSFNLM